jgi:hypothetical protein
MYTSHRAQMKLTSLNKRHNLNSNMYNSHSARMKLTSLNERHNLNELTFICRKVGKQENPNSQPVASS